MSDESCCCDCHRMPPYRAATVPPPEVPDDVAVRVNSDALPNRGSIAMLADGIHWCWRKIVDGIFEIFLCAILAAVVGSCAYGCNYLSCQRPYRDGRVNCIVITEGQPYRFEERLDTCLPSETDAPRPDMYKRAGKYRLDSPRRCW